MDWITFLMSTFLLILNTFLIMLIRRFIFSRPAGKRMVSQAHSLICVHPSPLAGCVGYQCHDSFLPSALNVFLLLWLHPQVCVWAPPLPHRGHPNRRCQSWTSSQSWWLQCFLSDAVHHHLRTKVTQRFLKP